MEPSSLSKPIDNNKALNLFTVSVSKVEDGFIVKWFKDGSRRIALTFEPDPSHPGRSVVEILGEFFKVAS